MKFYVYKIIIDDKNANEIEVKLNDDLVNFQWTEINNLKKIRLTPPLEDLFKKLNYIKYLIISLCLKNNK